MGIVTRVWCTWLFAMASLQAAAPDSLPAIYYQIVSLDVEPERTVIKILLPPQFTTAQLMEQVRLVVCWPGDNPPEKPMLIYVFPDTAPINQPYKIGALYRPHRGFSWDVRDWKPIPWPAEEPGRSSKELYNQVVEQLLSKTVDFSGEETEAIQSVARTRRLPVQQVRRAYFHVKHWLIWQKLKREYKKEIPALPSSFRNRQPDNSHLAP